MQQMPKANHYPGQLQIKMEFETINIPGAYLIKLTPYIDERGAFTRLFCLHELKKIGFNQQITQVNHSFNKDKGTLRGMHFQYPPNAEVKIIRCLSGLVYDVMVDLRKNSPAYLQHYAVELSPVSYNAILIPKGCAHGFQTLQNDCQLLYLHTAFYNKASEGGVRYNDPMLNIKWPLPPQNITEKDTSYALLNNQFKGIMPYQP